MKLLFRQRIFSWLDSYDIYNEKGETLFVVRGQLSWGHCLKIYDAFGEEVGKVKEKIVPFLPKFELFADGRHLGSVKKNFSLFSPSYSLDFLGWKQKAISLNGTTPFAIEKGTVLQASVKNCSISPMPMSLM